MMNNNPSHHYSKRQRESQVLYAMNINIANYQVFLNSVFPGVTPWCEYRVNPEPQWIDPQVEAYKNQMSSFTNGSYDCNSYCPVTQTQHSKRNTFPLTFHHSGYPNRQSKTFPIEKGRTKSSGNQFRKKSFLGYGLVCCRAQSFNILANKFRLPCFLRLREKGEVQLGECKEYEVARKNKTGKKYHYKEGDWRCLHCMNINFRCRLYCNQCGVSKQLSIY